MLNLLKKFYGRLESSKFYGDKHVVDGIEKINVTLKVCISVILGIIKQAIKVK